MSIVALARRAAIALGLPIVLLAAWWVASADSTSPFWPPLQKIIQTFPTTWTWDRFVGDVVPSLTRLAIGYALAVIVGIVLGTAIGLMPRLRALSEPVLEFFRAIPPPVMVPIIALFAGYTGSLGKVLTIALGCLWPILLNTVEGVRGLEPTLTDTARSYRLSTWRRLTFVVLPGASPRIFAGARQALSIGVILMVISELFGANRGLGAAIVQFQRSFAIPQMWTGIIVLGLIGVVLAALFRAVENRMLAWYQGQRQIERGE
ncbi:ABC transporter permease [Demequina soli]|uniref:ABC transporter permease n=1 Tax=Demequina soli TaxID=1638987 RepID=UPI000782D862|nr:ABC transporter permease [Demequina soli]